MKTGTAFLPSAIALFKQYKQLADNSIAQVKEADIYYKVTPESNSIYIIIKHMAGNMKSRWTNFLTTDGEKPWRKRDAEFEEDNIGYNKIIADWEQGWDCLLNTLESLNDVDLGKIVTIRGEAHSVLEAVNRQIAHYAYHVGQIVFIAKGIQSTQWKSLSISKGNPESFNNNFKP